MTPGSWGAGPREVPLPALSDAIVPLAAVNSMATGDPRYVLPYHHYSVVLNKERRLALLHRREHRRCLGHAAAPGA